MNTIQIKVKGMTCGGCVRSIESALGSRDGINEAKADLDSGIVTVGFDPALIRQSGIQSAIEDAGFDVAT